MHTLARRGVGSDPLRGRALRQAGRELLLAQSSDWAFIMKTGTTVPYATRRFNEHTIRFTRLYEALKAGQRRFDVSPVSAQSLADAPRREARRE